MIELTDGANVTSDNDIMFAVRDGDLERLGELFTRYHKRLYNYFVLSTRNTHVSEDLVQEVFLRILKYRKSFRANGSFSTWLYSVARNVRNDRLAGSGPHTEQIDDNTSIASTVPGPDESLEYAESVSLLKEALASLPVDMRDIIILSRYEDMKYREIGKLLGCSEGAVKVRMYRAMKELSKTYHSLAGGESL